MLHLASHPSPDHDLAALEARALRRRHRYTRTAQHGSGSKTQLLAALQRFPVYLRTIPRRYALHLLVAASVPLAIELTHLHQATAPAALVAPAPAPSWSLDFSAPAVPLSLDSTGDLPVPDSAFAEIDALAEYASNPDLLMVRPVPATIVAESAHVRNGPGSVYDQVGQVASGMTLTLLARAGDWYKAQREDGSIVWVMSELLSMDATAASLLPEALDIPAPPPPKIATVIQPNLNLRDGPDTVYVGMVKLEANIQLDLLARYNDWFQVQTSQGQAGWVKGEFLNIAPGVTERIQAVTEIPDPNPALIGMVSGSSVNLRSGPGTAYGKAGSIKGGTQLDLLARYNDWLKVRTTDGRTGWVSDELINVSDYIARRVQVTRDIPALPRSQPVVAARTQPKPAQANAPAREAAPAPAPAAAFSSVVDFAMQFVGTDYVWGGTSPKGFDCSGFVMYVYKQFGLSLPHSSAGQYNTSYGAVVGDPSELMPGDIVFFVNTYKRGISHVGIYVGGGSVVQALSPGRGVGVASISSGYWRDHYYSAIRPTR